MGVGCRVCERGGVMEQSILKLKYEDVYEGGTYLTIIEENEVEKICYKIKQIMPLASGKFLIERTRY